MKKIVLTGGGTAGHVTPNIALLPRLIEKGYEVYYIGSYDGVEKSIAQEYGIPYYGISSGKLRRYLDIKNLTDPVRIVKGYEEAKKILKELAPDVVFSKGGFVSVPVVLGARACKIPAIIHESDMTPGLANKICIHSARKICCNFPETLQHLPADKAVLSGSPIREDLFKGDADAARRFCGLWGEKPVLLATGGSLGSVVLNNAIRMILPELLEQFQVVHLCGQGKMDASLEGMPGYKQIEFVSKEMRDLLALSSIVVSRAGANAICELLALNKPNVLIPLSKNASRGDQILNARSFEKQGFSCVLEEEEVTKESLLEAVHSVYNNRSAYIDTMSRTTQMNAISIIIDLLEEAIENESGADA